MGLFGKGNVMNMVHYEGLPGFGRKYATAMELDEENQCLRFKARAFKDVNEVKLPLNKVTKSGYVRIAEIEHSSKSGKSEVGGFIFGSAGAILSTMSDKDKKTIAYLYIINYVSKEETKAIVLQDNGGNFNSISFQSKLQSYLPKPDINEDGEVVL